MEQLLTYLLKSYINFNIKLTIKDNKIYVFIKEKPIKISTCIKKCCCLEYTKYSEPFGPWLKHTKYRAGVIVYNTKNNTVLLIRSVGYKWGFPKGEVEINENIKKAAVRELSEETGIVLTKKDLNYNNCIIINHEYYFIYKTNKNIPYQRKYLENDVYNDVTGIGYVSLPCLIKNKVLMNKLTTCCQKSIELLIQSKYS